MTEERNSKTSERKIDLPVDDNLMDLVDELTENTEEDEVIDLMEETEALLETDDDIIELEDEPDLDSSEDELIDLVDEVEGETSQESEDIIDLEEETVDLLSEPESDDSDLIDLDLEAEETESPIDETHGIIDLADAVEEATSVAEKIGIEADGGRIGLVAETESLKGDEPTFPQGVTLTDQQIDLALERVIKKMFAERINGLLTTIIDRTIIRELKALQDKLSGK